jgi:hypothetical protein
MSDTPLEERADGVKHWTRNTMKTSELTGAALDWAVAEIEAIPSSTEAKRAFYKPSTNWAQGGKIIEREGIDLIKQDGYWDADDNGQAQMSCMVSGPTPLIAAMRCYVASKLGDEVDVPEELL